MNVSTKTRKIFVLLISALFLVSTFFMENIKVGFSNSGVFAIYYSDIFAVMGWIFLIVYTALNFKKTNRNYKWTLGFLVLFSLYCLVVTAIRFKTKDSPLSSFAMPRAIIMSIWVYLFLLTEEIKLQILEKGFLIFSIILSVLCFYISFFDTKFTYTILQNLAIRTIVQILVYPIIIAATIHQKSKLAHAALLIATFSVLFSSLMTGSRINAFLIPLVIVVGAYSLHLGKVNWIKSLTATIVFTIIFTFVFSFGMRKLEYGLQRNPIFSKVIRLEPVQNLYKQFRYKLQVKLDSDAHINSKIEDEEDLDDVADKSAKDSAESRVFALQQSIQDMKSNLLFGAGYKQYQYTYKHIDPPSTVTIQPHNFLIEYTLSFGLIGLFLFIMFTWVPVVKTVMKYHRKDNRYLIILLLLQVFSSIGIGLFQPIFLNPVVLIYIYLGLGYFIIQIKGYND